MKDFGAKVAVIGNKIKQFLRETVAELKKVTWPDRKYVVAATILIIVIVILVSLFVMLVDYGFTAIFKMVQKRV